MNTLHQPIRSSLVDGVATIAFAFAGRSANTLTLERLRALVEACEHAAAHPDVEIVVLSSDRPDGFSVGLASETVAHLACSQDRLLFTALGQRLMNRLAGLPTVTVARIAGPCRGVGLELALACDYRLAVARADSWVGFESHVRPAWGGSARLPCADPGVVTAREATRLGLFHDAFCERRARIEFEQHLDHLRARPRKPMFRESWFGPTRVEKLARERTEFAATPLQNARQPIGGVVPKQVGIWGLTPESASVAIEVCARGGQAVVVPIEGDLDCLTAALEQGRLRGRWTPLEAEQARTRVRVTGDVRALKGLAWVVPGDATTARTLPVTPRESPDTILSYYHALGLDPVLPVAELRASATPLAVA